MYYFSNLCVFNGYPCNFSFSKTKPILVADRGLTPLPPQDQSATNRVLFDFPSGNNEKCPFFRQNVKTIAKFIKAKHFCLR